MQDIIWPRHTQSLIPLLIVAEFACDRLIDWPSTKGSSSILTHILTIILLSLARLRDMYGEDEYIGVMGGADFK